MSYIPHNTLMVCLNIGTYFKMSKIYIGFLNELTAILFQYDGAKKVVEKDT